MSPTPVLLGHQASLDPALESPGKAMSTGMSVEGEQNFPFLPQATLLLATGLRIQRCPGLWDSPLGGTVLSRNRIQTRILLGPVLGRFPFCPGLMPKPWKVGSGLPHHADEANGIWREQGICPKPPSKFQIARDMLECPRPLMPWTTPVLPLNT